LWFKMWNRVEKWSSFLLNSPSKPLRSWSAIMADCFYPTHSFTNWRCLQWCFTKQSPFLRWGKGTPSSLQTHLPSCFSRLSTFGTSILCLPIVAVQLWQTTPTMSPFELNLPSTQAYLHAQTSCQHLVIVEWAIFLLFCTTIALGTSGVYGETTMAS